MFIMFETRRKIEKVLVTLLCVSIFFIACSGGKEKYLRLGEESLQKRKFQQAIMAFRTAADIDQNSVEAYYGLAKAYQATGQISEAIAALEKAARLAPENLEIKVRLGSLYLSVSPPQVAETERILNEIFAVRDDYVEAYILKANLLAMKGATEEEVVAVFNRAIELEPNKQETYFALARFLRQKGKHEQAEKALKEALSKKETAIAYLEYGDFLSKTNRVIEAETMFQKAVSLSPTLYEAHEMLASFYLSLGRLTEAEQAYKNLAASLDNSAEGLTELANFYRKIGRDDDAIAVFEEILKNEPEYAAARYHLAEIYLSREETEKARQQAEALLSVDKKDAQALVLRARAFLQEGNPEQAIRDLEEALRLQPTSKSALFYIVQALLDLGDAERARIYVSDLEKYHPDYLQAKLLRIQIETSAGNTEKALQEANQLIELATASQSLKKKALSARGLIFLQQGKLTEAEQDLRQALKIEPLTVTDMINLARVYVAQKNLSEAMKLYEKALETDKENLDALLGLVNILKNQQKYSDAHDRINRFADKNEKLKLLPAIYSLRAQVFRAEGKLAEAEAELEKAIRTDENYLPAYFAYADLLILQGRLDRALTKYQEIIQKRPSSTVYTLIGMLEESRSNWAEAEANYRKAIELNRSNSIALNNLAWTLATHTNGNLDEALSFAQLAVELNRNEASFYDTLGWIYFKKGLLSQAIESFKRAVALDESKARHAGAERNPAYRLRLAQALVQAGEKESARKELELALKMKESLNRKDTEEAKNLLRSLSL